MTDAALSEPVVLNRPDGTSLTFKRCSPADRIAYRSVFRVYRKHWLKQSLEVLGITSDAAVAHFNALDRSRLYESDVNRWLNEPEGQNEAILLSLRVGKSDKERDAVTMADVYALNLSDDESLTVAAGVFNVPLIDPTKAGSARPLASSGGTGIGGGTPTSSVDSPAAPTPSPSPSTPLNPTSPTPTTSAA